jgi:glycosyltransferase involved in cell wall biosynthesis
LVDYCLSLLTSRVIAVSAGEAGQLRLRCADRARRVVVIANGVSIPQERVDPSVIDQRPLRVVHVTRFVFQKNPDLLVAVVEELRKLGALGDFRFVILGDGPDRPAIEARMATLGLSPYVEFCGAVSDMGAQYRRAFCLLSTSRWEGLPLALIEAMSAGVPVVATDVVGNRDAVDPGKTGFLFDPTRPDEAAGHLLALSRSASQWQAQSDAARARVETDFSETRMADATLGLYREILSPRHPFAEK